MSKHNIEKAQVRVNSICDDFANLGYVELPYPKVVRESSEIPELRSDLEREGFEFRGAGYFPLLDKIYLMLNLIESRGEELRRTIYHELLHQVMYRKLMENGCCFSYFSCKKLAFRWQQRRMRIAFLMWANLLFEHFSDIVIESTLEEKGVKQREIAISADDMQILKAWALGPIEVHPNNEDKIFFLSQDFGQELLTMFWLIEGVEVYGHALFGDKLYENTFHKTAPRFFHQLREIFQGLSVEVSSQTIVEHFRNLCDIAALEIDYDYIWRDEIIGREPESEKVMCPFILGLKLDRINEILKSFLNEGKY